MSKIVIVDNGGQFTHLEGRAMQEIGVDYEIVDNEENPKKTLKNSPDGIILSGGPSIENSGNSESYLSGELPVLGICLGHQIIARHFGGKVDSGKYGGFADIDIDILDKKDLFESIEDSISVWSSHKDQVVELPDNFIRTAESEICEIEAMRHSSLPIYGVQFHPEVAHTEKGLDIFRNFVSVTKHCENAKRV